MPKHPNPVSTTPARNARSTRIGLNLLIERRRTVNGTEQIFNAAGQPAQRVNPFPSGTHGITEYETSATRNRRDCWVIHGIVE
jgi:hypothetical protein